jgi:surfactin synthase thioesterase subunit
MRQNNKLIKNIEKIEKDSTVLFCFPFAGGGVSVYKEWIDYFDDSTVVCPVQLPGRGERMMEKPYTQMDALQEDLIEEIRPYKDNKIILFGHSMGAKIAYETGRRLENLNIGVAGLIISGSRAPHVPERDPIHHLEDQAFEEELTRFNGLPKEFLENRELLNFFTPMLRADFTLVENYCKEGVESLKCPIVAFGGHEDEEASLDDLKVWQSYSHSGFKYQMFEGGHFFIREKEQEVLQEIEEKIARLVAINEG